MPGPGPKRLSTQSSRKGRWRARCAARRLNEGSRRGENGGCAAELCAVHVLYSPLLNTTTVLLYCCSTFFYETV